MKHKTQKCILKNDCGMTLVELVVVLGIMAAVAGMAMTFVGDMGARGRYDETTNRLKLIREAVVGNGVEPGRFLRDMGRLPMVQSTEQGRVLSELWTPGTDAYASVPSDNLKNGSGMDWPSSDIALGLTNYSLVPETVSLYCGWNGPYLQVNDQADARVYDGFGNNFLAAIASGADRDTAADWYSDPGESGEPAIGDTIFGVLSRGSDGDFTATAWDEENQPGLFKYPATTTLEVKVVAQDLSVSPPVWESLVYAPAWSTGAKSSGDTIVDSTGTYVFKCTTGGDSATSEPTWNTTTPGDTTSDGSVKWTYLGETATKRQYVNKLRVAFFVPSIGSTTTAVSWFKSFLSTSGLQSPVTFSDSSITPGLRKVSAYAYISQNVDSLRIPSNPVETVDLEFGTNYVTLYLR